MQENRQLLMQLIQNTGPARHKARPVKQDREAYYFVLTLSNSYLRWSYYENENDILYSYLAACCSLCK